MLCIPVRVPVWRRRHYHPIHVQEVLACAIQQLPDEQGLTLCPCARMRGEGQPILCARHRHVQQPTLLLQVDVALGNGLAQEFRREIAAPALPGRPFPVQQAGHEDVAELQTLRLVQRHQSNAFDVLRQLHAGRQLTAGRLVGIEVVHETPPACPSGGPAASPRRSAGSSRY